MTTTTETEKRRNKFLVHIKIANLLLLKTKSAWSAAATSAEAAAHQQQGGRSMRTKD